MTFFFSACSTSSKSEEGDNELNDVEQSSKSNNSTNQLVGCWQRIGKAQGVQLKDNGVAIVCKDGKSKTCEYSLDGKNLTINDSGDIDPMVILSLDENEFVMTDKGSERSGKGIKFKRITEEDFENMIKN